MRLIHLTDPHLTSLDRRRPGPLAGKRWLSWLSWQTRRRERHLRARLDGLVERLDRDTPDVWAVTGDLCQVGLDAEIDEAYHWLQRLAPPDRVLLVPGNHDVFARDSFASIARRWAAHMHVDPDRPEWPVIRRYGDVVLIGLNSAVVTPVFRAGGRLGDTVRARLRLVLREHRGLCRVVLLHHPPIPGVCRRRKALEDDAELGALLRREAPALVLHGHLHRNGVWTIGDRGPTRVFCTASASAGGALGAATARAFEIVPDRGGFRIAMQLVELDDQGRTGVRDSVEWSSAG